MAGQTKPSFCAPFHKAYPKKPNSIRVINEKLVCTAVSEEKLYQYSIKPVLAFQKEILRADADLYDVHESPEVSSCTVMVDTDTSAIAGMRAYAEVSA